MESLRKRIACQHRTGALVARTPEVLMAYPRKQRLAAFREKVLSGSSEEADGHLFRLLFGLPAQVQLELALTTTRRFLPIFRANHPEDSPEVAWPETVLSDLDAYYREHGVEVLDAPEKDAGGDASFWYALYALLDAVSYANQDNVHKVTPACCTALIWAVGARAANVRYADDSEAVRAFESGDREALAGRSMHHNVASQAVKKREWLLVADWLEEHQVGDYPEAGDVDEAEREKWFEWWQDREFCSELRPMPSAACASTVRQARSILQGVPCIRANRRMTNARRVLRRCNDLLANRTGGLASMQRSSGESHMGACIGSNTMPAEWLVSVARMQDTLCDVWAVPCTDARHAPRCVVRALHRCKTCCADRGGLFTRIRG
jgi:hypothetical protein